MEPNSPPRNRIRMPRQRQPPTISAWERRDEDVRLKVVRSLTTGGATASVQAESPETSLDMLAASIRPRAGRHAASVAPSAGDTGTPADSKDHLVEDSFVDESTGHHSEGMTMTPMDSPASDERESSPGLDDLLNLFSPPSARRQKGTRTAAGHRTPGAAADTHAPSGEQEGVRVIHEAIESTLSDDLLPVARPASRDGHGQALQCEPVPEWTLSQRYQEAPRHTLRTGSATDFVSGLTLRPAASTSDVPTSGLGGSGNQVGAAAAPVSISLRSESEDESKALPATASRNRKLTSTASTSTSASASEVVVESVSTSLTSAAATASSATASLTSAQFPDRSLDSNRRTTHTSTTGAFQKSSGLMAGLPRAVDVEKARLSRMGYDGTGRLRTTALHHRASLTGSNLPSDPVGVRNMNSAHRTPLQVLERNKAKAARAQLGIGAQLAKTSSSLASGQSNVFGGRGATVQAGPTSRSKTTTQVKKRKRSGKDSAGSRSITSMWASMAGN